MRNLIELRGTMKWWHAKFGIEKPDLVALFTHIRRKSQDALNGTVTAEKINRRRLVVMLWQV